MGEGGVLQRKPVLGQRLSHEDAQVLHAFSCRQSPLISIGDTEAAAPNMTLTGCK